ncbi:MalY/PatB family protein [Bifidobacterium platyrrhinorum]|uniref:cysteine-S-conjugate beta-lyase n=1 Tax=Bifidobacterium platyrrhinorum TaxID=2661628 RepID=A0A6L9SRX5_9BIFI|nr:aminotransferase class I/II-fold pyridoxal phosphate-dependent enzyme [Bifidobacterium platyrrhinorum]NEG55264.1 aminotransferase class I/II-fold pyridoxal phosphate-dependent enzyme [Bifidobacterium platyrrhinorum]
MFDFTTTPDRHGRDALAVDDIGSGRGFAPGAPKPGFDAIPMWIADMNFATAPAVTEAVAARLAHPLFGYFEPEQAYFDAVIDWQRRRNGVKGLEPRHIGYENGVLGGLVSALHVFATPGDSVLLHSPTYNGFTMAVEGAGYRIEHSPLKRDEDGVWRMDFEDMDRRIREKRIHVAVFCSPHNPCGRVWERWEIERAMEVYRANDCVVVSDEIWSDLILDREHRPHIPTQSVSEDARRRVIAMYAPCKTFNLSGLVGGYRIVYDDYLRDRLDSYEAKSFHNEMNVLWMHALIGAYSRGGEAWLDGLLPVLAENLRLGCEYFAGVPGVEAARPQGTYMLFLDCERWCADHGWSADELLRRGWDVGVAWQDGRLFAGTHTIRMNFALPTARVREALDRLAKHVFTD